MNPRGSYKALRNHSRAAMLAAIEIYNKPRMTYRDETFCILLINSWALLQKAKIRTHKNKAVAQYLKEISMATKELESQELDTTRFLTVYTVNLQSVKKVTSADIKVAVAGFSEGSEPLIVERRVDPNISHSWRQKDVLKKLGFELNGIRFSPYTFQALVWMYDIKNKPHLCWIPSATGGSPQYSPEIATLLSRLSKQEIQTALKNYSENQKKTRKRYHSAS